MASLTPSSIGKALAALRSPKNMKRGDPDHYRKLASLSHAKRKANRKNAPPRLFV